MRKVVQIALLPASEEYKPAMAALCDDGTVWTRAIGGVEWRRAVDIPQDEPAQNAASLDRRSPEAPCDLPDCQGLWHQSGNGADCDAWPCGRGWGGVIGAPKPAQNGEAVRSKTFEDVVDRAKLRGVALQRGNVNKGGAG